MTYPADDVMLSLSALAHMKDSAIQEDGDRLLVVHDQGKWWVPLAHVDELAGRGWVNLDGGPEDVTATERGRYWLARWEKGKKRAANGF